MPAHGPTTVVGLLTAIGRATARISWYPQVNAWWTARTAARHHARLATLQGRWDAQREAIRAPRADGAYSLALLRYGLAL